MLSAVPKPVLKDLAQYLEKQGLPHRIKKFKPCSGGCINNGGELLTGEESFFLKWNSATRYPAMFATEGKGLKKLHNTGAINLPEFIYDGEAGEYAYILMEFIQPGARKPNYWELFGQQLAALHGNSSEQFGLDHDNYIGSLPQYNNPHSDWPAFFIIERLERQLRMAFDDRALDRAIQRQFEVLFPRLEGYFPVEQPALIHGDLWGGNLITNTAGNPCLIDPAVYYGHREAELAFTRLFGGFDREFYQVYQATFPLESGFDERCDLYNLYPLLVHVNLFGGGYALQVKGILKRFV